MLQTTRIPKALLVIGAVCLAVTGFGAAPRDTGPSASSEDLTPVVVTRVLDATTVETRQPEGDTERVRLLGIAAVACYERPALSRLTEIVKGRQVQLELPDDSRDRAGRLYGYLWLSGRLVNEQLVAEGVAVPLDADDEDEYDDVLEAAVTRAREAGLGLWSRCRPKSDQDDVNEPDNDNASNESSGRIARESSGPRRVAPISTWECPVTHPFKAGIIETGAWVYTRPTERRGPRIKPVDCFASEADAQQAGYRYIGD